ncbi:MAG: hypothetical protein PHR77_09205 [Kiritimatiellae bacterium]|nr:hypothetical protein [Kiritimatiellia bacterium]MDD5520028.1 hypothetical protein [Kiritimatiellia bacterium]
MNSKSDMKSEVIIKILLVVFLLGQTVVTAVSAAEEEDWLKKHAVIKTTETQSHDDNGDVNAVNTIKTTSINITQTCIETKTKDKTGKLVLTSRTTETVDTLGGRATIIESLLPGQSYLITTSITTVQKIPNGTVTTVQSRGTNGVMQIVNRTTATIHPDGSTTTIVEALDKRGRLAPKQTTTFEGGTIYVQ